MKKKIVKFFLTFSLVLISLIFLQELLQPKYMSKVVEGRLIEEYYKEEKDHDVIFIGDCEVYENFSPKVLWEEYGINSYIRGSAQQLIWQSYYLLEDVLRYEKPDVVIFNVLSMKYDTPQREEYNRMSIEGMKWSMAKVNNIKASMTEDEHFLDYVFPILRYHSRWNDLSKEDFQYMFHTVPLSFNGYYMRTDVRPLEKLPKAKKLPDYQFGENAYLYLDKMTELCKKNNIELILIKSPSVFPYWYDEWEVQMEEYAEKNDLRYINFLDLVEETSLDYTKDTYDAGLHMNLFGAEKISRYLGELLRDEYQLEDRRSEENLSKIWDQKIEDYNNEKNRQLEEQKGKVNET